MIEYHRSYLIIKEGFMVLKKIILAGVLCLFSGFVLAEKLSLPPEVNSVLAQFPNKQEHLMRNFIVLPALENERNYKVEVFFGKTLMVDCNPKLLQGEIPQSFRLNDTPYSYYTLNNVNVGNTYQQKCMDSTKNKQFVPALDSTLLLPYNSKIPLVFYTPRDVQIKYRILFPSQFQDAYKG